MQNALFRLENILQIMICKICISSANRIARLHPTDFKMQTQYTVDMRIS